MQQGELNLFNIRTDLAVEAKELAGERAAEKGELPGVASREYTEGGASVTVVEILDERGEQAIGKQGQVYNAGIRPETHI